jgi:hypothetical protein
VYKFASFLQFLLLDFIIVFYFNFKEEKFYVFFIFYFFNGSSVHPQLTPEKNSKQNRDKENCSDYVKLSISAFSDRIFYETF